MPVSSKMLESQSSGIEPIQIDVTRFKRITPDEKERRQSQDLCLYYCGSGHKVRDCQIKESVFKTRGTTIKSKLLRNEDVQLQ